MESLKRLSKSDFKKAKDFILRLFRILRKSLLLGLILLLCAVGNAVIAFLSFVLRLGKVLHRIIRKVKKLPWAKARGILRIAAFRSVCSLRNLLLRIRSKYLLGINELPRANAHGIPAKRGEYVFVRFVHELTLMVFVTKNSRKVNKALGGVLMAVGVFVFLLMTLANAGRFWKNMEASKKESLPANIRVTLDNFFGNIKVLPETITYKKADALKIPLRVIVPRLSVDLEIFPARILNNSWETTEKGASYMLGSAVPSEVGNTVLYGHAKTKLFAPLKKLKKDDVVYVLTKEKWYQYKVSDIKEVAPTETTVVAPTKEATLTMFTCSAFLDSKRLVVVAKPVI